MTQQIVRSDDGYQLAKDLARDNVCANNHELVVRWSADGHYVAVCLRDECEGAGIKPRRDVHNDELRERFERNPQLMRSLATTRDVPLTSQAIRELDSDKLMARVPDRYGTTIEVSRPMKIQLAQLARIYGLDPLWDLMVYESRPYVTYDGRLRKLREHPDYRGHKVRPLNRSEKEEWGYEPADLVIQCDVDMGPRGAITDWGIVRATEVTAALEKARRDGKKSAPVGIHPQQIGIKRAVSRASKQAVGIDLPTIVETAGRVIDVQEVRGPRPPVSPADAETQARRRFWSIARGSPPDGLGLSDADVHRLLGVESASEYPGGWDQALSDLTERAAAELAESDDDSDEDIEDHAAEPPPAAAPAGREVEEPTPPSASRRPEASSADQAQLDEASAKNTQLLLDAEAIGVKGLRALTAAKSDSLGKLDEKNAELLARIRSRNGELDAESADGGRPLF